MPDENGNALIEEISLEDALRDGHYLRKSPQEIATGVRKWHELTVAYGAGVVPQEESEMFFKASKVADEKTEEALGGLRDAAVTAYVGGEIRDPKDRAAFAKAYKAADGDPTRLTDDRFITAAAGVNEIVGDPVFGRVGGESSWQDIGSGQISLGKFKARPSGDGAADVFISARNKKDGWFGRRVNVQLPKPGDVEARMAELEEERKMGEGAIAAQRAFMDTDQEMGIFERMARVESSAAGGDIAMANLLKVQEAGLLETENAIVELKNGREAVLMAERVTGAVKDSDFAGQMGERGLGPFIQDMQRGLVKFYKNTELTGRVIAGDKEGAAEVSEMIGRMEQILPGSSGSRFRGGLAGFTSEFGETVGNMAPTIATGLATGGTSTAAQVAGRTATLGSMAPNAFGGGAADALNIAALREEQATAAALAGDEELAAKLNAEAKAARDNMVGHALATTAIEIGTEILLPADELFKVRGVGGGQIGKRIGSAVGSNTVEESVAEVGNQALALQTLNDNRASVGDIARAAAMGGLMGGGIQTLGVGRDALLSSGESSAAVEGVPQTIETPKPDGIPAMLPKTPPSAVDPMGTIPETQATIAEQMARVERGTKPAMLVPGRSAAEIGELPEGLQATETGAGVMVTQAGADSKQVQEAAEGGKLGELLGYGVPMRPENPDRAVVLRNQQGLEVDAVAADQTTEQTVRAALTARAEEGDAISVEPMDKLLQTRMEQEAADLQPVTESPATMAELAGIAGVDRIDLTETLESGESPANQPERELAEPREVQLQPEDDSADAIRARIERLEAMQFPDPALKTEAAKRIAEEKAKLAELEPEAEPEAEPEVEPVASEVDEFKAELQRREDLLKKAKRLKAADAVELLKPEVFGVDGETKAGSIRQLQSKIDSLAKQVGKMEAKQREPEPELSRARGNRKIVRPAHVRNAANVMRKKMPGLFNGRLKIYSNSAEFFADRAYNSEVTYGADTRELIENPDTEGFYDWGTGYAIVFADQISVRPGETPARAVARVIVHETVGHGGLSHLMTADEHFAKQFDGLAAGVAIEHGAELDAIAVEPGYANLNGERDALVLEWFARRVEAMAPAQFGLNGLAAKIWDAFKGMLARAFSGFSRKAATNVEIRNLVRRAAAAWRAGTAAPTSAGGIALSMGGTKIFHREGEAFRVNNQANRALLTGSPLPRAFAQIVAENDTQRRALDETSAQIGRDLDAAIEAHAKRNDRPLADVYDDVAKILDGAQPGGIAVYAASDKVLAERLRIARNHLDNMSGAILHTIPAGSLRDAMRENVGKWLRRSYAAFDPDADWNYDKLTAAALDGKEVNGQPAAKIIDDALTVLVKENPTATPAELESIMRDLMDRDTFSELAGGGSAVKKQVSSLLVRAEIPKAIRALMGEETNPVHRFSRSSQFQAQFLQRHQEQIALRNIGLQGDLFRKERGNEYTVQIPGGELGLAWSPMKGLWTTPQLWQAIKKTRGTTAGDDVGNIFWKGIKWTSNEAKLNRVALNPDSWMVNVLGNVAALVQTGDLFYSSFFVDLDKAAHKRPKKGIRRVLPARLDEAIQLRRSGKAKDGDDLDAAYEGVTNAQRALMTRLAGAGVVGNDLTQGELRDTTQRHLLQWLEQDTKRDRLGGAAKGAVYAQATVKGLGGGAQLAAAAAGAAAGGVLGYEKIHKINMWIASMVMTGPDQVGRVVGYLGNYETALAAGMRGDEAFNWATERTRNTFPDYGKLPTVVRNLSRLGVLGSFIAFQWEVYRNSIWNLRYAREELMSGNPALIGRGVRRVAGVSAMGVLASGGIAALFGAAGADDERNKRWRKWFGAPWEKHSMLAFNKYDETGVSYFNTSYLLPQATILELARAAFDGSDPLEAVGNLVSQSMQQFAGSSVHVTPIIQALTGRDGRGNEIAAAETTAGRIAERVAHASKTILEPGWAQKIDRIGYALRKADRNGRDFTLQEEGLRLFGVRSYSRTWGRLVKGAYSGDRLAKEYDRIRLQANRALGANTPGARRKVIERANEQIERLNETLEEYERDLIFMQIPKDVRASGRKDGGVPKRGFAPVEYREGTNRVGSIPAKRKTKASGRAAAARAALGL